MQGTESPWAQTLWQEAAGLHLAWTSPPVGAHGLWHWLPVLLEEERAGQETEGSRETPARARVKEGEPRK